MAVARPCLPRLAKQVALSTLAWRCCEQCPKTGLCRHEHDLLCRWRPRTIEEAPNPDFSLEGLERTPCPGISVYTIISYSQDKEVNHENTVYAGIPSLSSPPPPRSHRAI